MKTNFPRNNNPRRIIFLALLGGVLVLAGFYRESIRNGFGEISASLASPIFAIGDSTENSPNALFSFFRDRKKLSAEIALLEQERADLLLRLSTKESLETEYESLLQSVKRTSKKKIMAAAMLGGVNVPYETILLDVGLAHGLRGEEKVFAGDVPLGFIEEIRSNTATVLLYSAPGRETNVMIGEKRTPAIASGRGGGDFLLKVPATIFIEVGAPILLPGLVPSILGSVFSVEKKEHDAFQILRAHTLANIHELGVVGIELHE